MDPLEPAVALPIFIASLLGSPHCAGMCGGFVSIYSHDSPGKFSAHALYSLGRLITYLGLGVTAAWLGSGFDSVAQVGRVSALVVGASLISFGALQIIFGRLNFFASPLDRLGKTVGAVARPIFKMSGKLKPLLIGLVTTLLPCGWLYTFVALALASASALTAIGIMTLFWLGTLPIMVTFGLASRAITSKLGRFLPRITGLLLVIGGLLSLTIHLQHAHHHQGEATRTFQQCH